MFPSNQEVKLEQLEPAVVQRARVLGITKRLADQWLPPIEDPTSVVDISINFSTNVESAAPNTTPVNTTIAAANKAVEEAFRHAA